MVKLYNGDCMKLMKNLADKSIDLIYTDPPYDVGIFKEGSGGTVNTIAKLDKTLIPINKITESNYNLKLFCEEAVRVLKNINIYIWCNKKQIIEYFNIFVNKYKCKYDILFWNKTNALPTYSNKYLTDCEYCLYFHKNTNVHPESYTDAKTLFQSPINRENKIYKHPNIKPLDFVMSHIRNSSNKGDLILDPFMGSGTTGLACKKLDRNFIGYEIDLEYFNIAKIE